MTKILRLTFFCALFSVGLLAQTIAPNVRLAPYTVQKFPEFKPVADLTGSVSSSFLVMVNDSDKPITAYMVVWTYTRKDGSPGRLEMGASMYGQNTLVGPPIPLVKAHSFDLIIPKTAWQTIYKDTTNINGPMVDSLAFADGMVYGPDSLHHIEKIIAEHEAAKALVAHVQAGKMQGKASASVYQELILGSNLRPRTSMGVDWLGRLAARARAYGSRDPGISGMTAAQAEAAYLSRLENLPNLPTFKFASKLTSK